MMSKSSGVLVDLAEHRHVVTQSVGRYLREACEPQRFRITGMQLCGSHRVARGKQSDLVAAPDQLLGQI